MQEQQVTVEGQTFPLPRPFHVLATANPVEYEGTYPLPEAQLDRFLVRVAFGYPDADGEWEVLGRRMARRREEQDLRQVVDAAELLDLQATMEDVTVVARGRPLLRRARPRHARPEHTLMGASPRGSLALMLVGRAYAVIRGRDYVTPDDVKAVAPSVLQHRVVVRPELWMSEVSSAHDRRRPAAHRSDPADRGALVVTSSWRPTRALGRALAIGLVVLVAAAVAGRGDLAVLGTPLVALGVWSFVTRPTTPPTATSHVDAHVAQEGDSLTWRVDVRVVPGLRDVAAHLPGDRWTTTTPSHGHVTGAVGDGASVPVGRRRAQRPLGRAAARPGTGGGVR